MKQCQRCNLNFPDNLKFCESCGSALVEASSPSSGSLRCPACGEPAKAGWKFCVKCRTPLLGTTGDLTQSNRPAPSPTLQLETPVASNVTRQPTEQAPSVSSQATLSMPRTPAPQEPTVTTPQIRVRCRKCRNLVDEDAEFCEFCGAPMFEDTASEVTQTSSQSLPPSPPSPSQPARSYQPEEWYAATDSPQHTYAPTPPPSQPYSPPPPQHRPTPPPTERYSSSSYTPSPPTAHYSSASYAPAPASTPTRTPSQPPVTAPQESHEKAPPSLSMLSSYGVQEETPSVGFRWWHGMILLVFVLLFFGGLGAAGWWWWSSGSSGAVSSSSPTPASGQITSSQGSTTSNETTSGADDELKTLRERRIRANPSEAAQITAALEAAEEKYPNDYRFPYERAKLSIKGIVSHHETFEALNEAAEKAIDNGKAQEMLDNLMADKDGDFYKPSRGHHEWEALLQALQSKNKAALKTH